MFALPFMVEFPEPCSLKGYLSVQKYPLNKQVVIEILNHKTFPVTLNTSRLKIFSLLLLVHTKISS